MQTFDEFIDLQLPRLLIFAGALTGDRHLGEDLVQDVLFKTHRRWSVIGEVDRPDLYVRRMLVNEFVSWRRKWARIIPRAELEDDARSPDPAVAVTERDALTRRLQRLPPKQRAVIVLRYFQALDDDRIAEMLGCSAGTVRSHASRALAALRIDGLDNLETTLSTVVKEA